MNIFYKLVLPAVFFLFIISAESLAQYDFDTLEVNVVGPGIIHYKINETTQPWEINYLEVDLKNPFVKLETKKSFDRNAEGREKTTLMAARSNSPGHWVVGAVNGDFFNLGDGSINHIQITDGEVLRKERANYPAIGFNNFNQVLLGSVSSASELIVNGTSHSITGINSARGDNSLISYNSYFGNNSGTNNAGSEILLTPVDQWITNDTVYAVVDSIAVSDGSMNLVKGKMVLSASGSFEQALEGNISKGDTVKILMNISPSIPRMDQMMGGHPRMIIDGVVNMNPEDGLVFNRHPRTAVGINQDTTKLYIIVVDGRQVTSAGMTLFELADYMISIGCYNAMNLDGGGSSTMVVRGEIENSPSDGVERDVANALMVISTAPAGSVSQIKISPSLVKIFIGNIQQFTVEGFDEYFNPVILSPSLIKYSLSKPSLGFISSNGLFSASTNSDTGYVIVEYGDQIKDSVQVIVKGVDRIKVLPETAVTDNSQIINFSAKVFDTDNVEQNVNPTQIQWSVSDTAVGRIDPAGQFQGKAEGAAYVKAVYMGKRDSAQVFVQIGAGTMILDPIESIDNWNVSGINIDSAETTISFTTEKSTEGSGSIQLDYSFTYHSGNFNWAYLNCDLQIFGIPDSILVDVFSDGATHRIFFDFEDAAGAVPRINANKIANNAGVFETIKGKLPSTASQIVYPLKLSRIAIALGSTSVNDQHYAGKIYLDNLRLKYKNEVTAVNEMDVVPSEFRLYQNYPNPFNPSTTISYSIPVSGFTTLIIYDLLGNEIATLVNEQKSAGTYNVFFDVSSRSEAISSGIYFYTLRSGQFTQTKKLVLIK